MSADDSDDALRISRRSLLGGLIVVHVVAGLFGLLLILPMGPHLGRHPVEAVVGLCFGQATLLAVWLGLGTSDWPLRASVATGGLVADCILVLSVTERVGRSAAEAVWIVFLTLAPAATVVAVLLALRPLGLRVQRLRPGAKLPQARLQRQFSMRYMLAATLVLALMLAAIQATRQHIAPTREITLAVTMGVIFGCSTLAALWLILGQARLRWRVLGVVVIAICLGGSLWLDPPGEIFVVLVVQSISQAASLVVVRWCGYRLAVSHNMGGA